MFDFFKKRETPKYELTEELREDYSNILPVANYFKNETGVTFDKQESILKNKAVTFCRQRKICSFDKLLQEISTNRDLKQELIDTLTTNETFFYREFKQIEDLVKLVKDAGKRVDILCAPSATGEEPYSIAIALLEAGISPYNFHIVGIDINSDAISKAKTARYKERNVRNLSSTIIENYFIKEQDLYILKESIKSQVSYKIVNIFDPSFSAIGKFDFIFSRNMLIYFDKETKLKAKKLLESLRKDPTQEIFFGHADLF
jgi:chemotaxis protein methyltransferase CheR